MRPTPPLCFATLALLSILALGCEKSPAPATRPTVPAPIATPPAAPEDHSLTPAEYIAAGFPAHDRGWGGQDMAKAGELLTPMAASTPDRLPRFRSAKSGPMFDRIVSPDNADLFRNRTLPVNARMSQLDPYMGGCAAIFKAYWVAFEKHAVGGRDIIELMNNQLRTSAAALELADEFMATVPANDPRLEVRRAGVEQMKRGNAMVVSGMVQSLTESGSYSAADRVVLADGLRQTLPGMLGHLPAGSRQEIVARIAALADDEALKDLRPAIVDLASAVDAAAKAAGK